MQLSPALQSPFSFHLGCGYDARKKKRKKKRAELHKNEIKPANLQTWFRSCRKFSATPEMRGRLGDRWGGEIIKNKMKATVYVILTSGFTVLHETKCDG